MSQARLFLMSIFILTASASMAFAHSGHMTPEGGIIAGLLHPFLGIDHHLAMVTVGLLSAQLGGRAMWTIPGSFLAFMFGGGILGMSGWDLPALEYGIVASIILLGLAVAVNRKFNLLVPLAFVGIFGVFHGHAHGTEMSSIANPGHYFLGFITATLALHVVGIIAGQFAVRSAPGATLLRLSGGTIAAVGVWFAVMT